MAPARWVMNYKYPIIAGLIMLLSTASILAERSILNPKILQVDIDGLKYESGNVGVHVNTPNATLDVSGDMTIQGQAETQPITHTVTSGTTLTIEWQKKNFARINLGMTAGSTLTLEFTAPPHPSALTLMINYTTSTADVSFPSTVLFPNNTEPTRTQITGRRDIFHFYYDGTNYYCFPNLDLRP